MFNPYDNTEKYNYLKKIRSQGTLAIQKNNTNAKKCSNTKIVSHNLISNHQSIRINPKLNHSNSQLSFQYSCTMTTKTLATTSNKTRLSEEIFKYDIKKIQSQQKKVVSMNNLQKLTPHLMMKSKQEDGSDVTSTQQSSFQQIQYVNSEYQLNDSGLFNKQKKVQFSQKLIQSPKTNKRISFLEKKQELRRKQHKTPSILKNNSRVLDQSIYSQTQKSYSIENSFAVRKKNKLNNSSLSSPNQIIKQKYAKILQRLKLQNNKNTDSKVSNKNNLNLQTSEYSTDENTSSKSYRIRITKKQQKSLHQYTDQLFPPVYSSIFRVIALKNSTFSSKKHTNFGKQVQWMRLSQLFNSQNAIIYNNFSQKTSEMRIFKSEIQQKSYYFSDNIIGAFNAIKNNRILLEKIFGKQQEINVYGIYLVNIYVDNAWKCIILDDYIPVVKRQIQQIKKGQKVVTTLVDPAFLNVGLANQNQEQKINQNQILYLWPFLLQKAYAAYYSCYDALNYGNIVDFLCQLSASPYQILKFPKIPNLNKASQQIMEQFQQQYRYKTQKLICKMNQKSIIAIGYSDDDLPYVPIHYQNLNHSFIDIKQQILTYYDPLSNYNAVSISFNEIGKLFNKIYFYNTKHYQNTTSCQVFPFKNKQDNKKIVIQQNISILESCSFRTFKLNQPTLGNLTVRQKDLRYLMKTQMNYIWVRVIVLMKQFNGYKWIDGKYSNKKSIIFNFNTQKQLEKGQYVLVIMPEWKQTHNRQLSIIFDSNNQSIKFQRKIVDQGCMDIAQRRGRLNQLNKSICSYTLVLEKVGLIIQNICNQRPKGDITVMRSINGLKARCKIIPINEQFYYPEQKIQTQEPKNQSLSYKPSQQKTQQVYKLKDQVQIDIPNLQSFTVVLKMIGGIDRRFFKAFNFG